MPLASSHSLILLSKDGRSLPLNIFIFISNASVAIWLWSNQNCAGIAGGNTGRITFCRPAIKNDSTAIWRSRGRCRFREQPRQIYESLGDSGRGCDLLASQARVFLLDIRIRAKHEHQVYKSVEGRAAGGEGQHLSTVLVRYGSLNSPACSCVSITLPASS